MPNPPHTKPRTHTHSLYNSLHCLCFKVKQSSVSCQSTHAQTQLTKSYQRIYLYSHSILKVCQCWQMLFFSFFLFSFFFSVEYFSSQLNLGFLTASRAFNSGKEECDQFVKVCSVSSFSDFSVFVHCDVETNLSCTKLNELFGKQLYVYL